MRKKKTNWVAIILVALFVLFPITCVVVKYVVKNLRTSRKQNAGQVTQTNTEVVEPPGMASDVESYGEVFAIRQPVVDIAPEMEILINPANGLSKYDLEASGATPIEKRLFADMEAVKMVV